MKRFLLVFILAIGVSDARWLRRGKSSQPQETSFIGEATNLISTALLQDNIDSENDVAFSPLGYSAILAILAEGASGETKEQIMTALHLPNDQKLIRTTYRYILKRLRYTNKFEQNKPELQNYFYVYKNYSINNDYKKILEEYYLTDVKSVERHTDYIPDDDDDDDYSTDTKVENQSNIKATEHPKEQNDDDKPHKINLANINYKPAKNIKEQIKLVKTESTNDKFDSDEETMVADEARNHIRKERKLTLENDVSSSFAVSNVDRKDDYESCRSIMLIFNGMYFRGSWKKPFDTIEPGLFYKSSIEKKQIPMLKTRGKFMTGSLPELDSEALVIPYDGGRYALMILKPRSRDGLTRLVADLPSVTISDIKESLTEEELQVSLPSFYAATVTKSVPALAKIGVSRIFGREAELTGMSDHGIFVRDLVQNVVVRVDNAPSASLLGASNTLESLKNLPLVEENAPRLFAVEHPFIFYVIDTLDNLILITGRVANPNTVTNEEKSLGLA
ncbi:neuroserpin [Zerene cesonia]|uniref:neuroserpin n=1 Tax=Zerene cesonia TaxID=33412 RepID=UPI0018E52BFE|nr:neuroserpin [Zerene cesonia]